MTAAPLPPVLREIADVAGLPAAERLARAHGGSRVYIPTRAGDEHWLVKLVGRLAADRLCAHYNPGVDIDVPIGPFGTSGTLARRVAELLHAGVSGYEAARRLRVSARTIRRMRAEGRLPDIGQRTLDDEIAAKPKVARPKAQLDLF